jgi:hypothetical protein
MGGKRTAGDGTHTRIRNGLAAAVGSARNDALPREESCPERHTGHGRRARPQPTLHARGTPARVTPATPAKTHLRMGAVPLQQAEQPIMYTENRPYFPRALEDAFSLPAYNGRYTQWLHLQPRREGIFRPCLASESSRVFGKAAAADAVDPSGIAARIVLARARRAGMHDNVLAAGDITLESPWAHTSPLRAGAHPAQGVGAQRP